MCHGTWNMVSPDVIHNWVLLKGGLDWKTEWKMDWFKT